MTRFDSAKSARDSGSREGDQPSGDPRPRSPHANPPSFHLKGPPLSPLLTAAAGLHPLVAPRQQALQSGVKEREELLAHELPPQALRLGLVRDPPTLRGQRGRGAGSVVCRPAVAHGQSGTPNAAADAAGPHLHARVREGGKCAPRLEDAACFPVGGRYVKPAARRGIGRLQPRRANNGSAACPAPTSAARRRR